MDSHQTSAAGGDVHHGDSMKEEVENTRLGDRSPQMGDESPTAGGVAGRGGHGHPSPRDDYGSPRHDHDEEDPRPHSDSRRRPSSPHTPSNNGGDPSNSDRKRDRDDDESHDNTSLLVRHLKFTTPPHTVRSYFEQCGPVKDVYLPLEYETGRPRGFGFVEFENARDAQDALRTLNDTEIDGARITISIAQHGRKTPSVMRARSGTYRRRPGGHRREPYSAPERYERGYSPRGYGGGGGSGGGSRSRDYEDRPARDYGRYERHYRDRDSYHGGREASPHRRDGYRGGYGGDRGYPEYERRSRY